ncbi:SAM-dependent methyltransferase [bacterium]|nr:SAM-dependent methyltransferase [bacterium]
MSPARRRRPDRGATGAAVEPLSYCDFVDRALFDPAWGYYSTGGVRFGEGGHYDTYPLALSPVFGRMVAHYAFRVWQRRGRPPRFELCELGAGNGQLCLDTLLGIDGEARRRPTWRAFAAATRYRIVERSVGLVTRQRRTLGPLAARVTWQRADLAQRAPAAFGPVGLIVANEVLDCLPHHKVVGTSGGPGVVHVQPMLHRRPLGPAALAAAMRDPAARQRVRFREIVRPLRQLPALARCIARYYPELRDLPPDAPPVFVAPRLASLLANTARCYTRADAIWIDYGELRRFHLRAPEWRKAFAGPPRSGRSIYDAPGADDITFMVDFTLAADAARDAGWQVVAYGPQAELARLSGIAVDDGLLEEIVRQRALVWMLALAGVGAEATWRSGAIGHARGTTAGAEPVRRYVARSLREFRRRRGATFKLLLLRR